MERISFRNSELAVLVIAAIAGAFGGACVWALSSVAAVLHGLLFRLLPGERVSELASLGSPLHALWPAAGGVLVGLTLYAQRLFRSRPVVDAVEANALHGGKMDLRESCVLTGQNLLSNGFGASVGLEAGYTQIASALAASLGARANLRRNLQRYAVASGAGGAIAAAFGAPLVGAAYAFEAVLGAYTIDALAPVALASLVGSLTSRTLGAAPHALAIPPDAVGASDFALAAVISIACAVIGIAVMRGAGVIERAVNRYGIPLYVGPTLGGLVIGALALASPIVLGAGHHALEVAVVAGLPLAAALTLLALKSAAAIVSVGSGFRGGLFFASLLIGSLVGSACHSVFFGYGVVPPGHGDIAALAGMAAGGAAIIGTPMTMAMLALAMADQVSGAGPTILAVSLATILVRRFFGYSFSTWRLHLRGESIRGAQDIGWVRDMTVGKLMRMDFKSISDAATIGEVRTAFPAGTANVIMLVDEFGGYHGLVDLADAHAAWANDSEPVATLARLAQTSLSPQMSVKAAAKTFEDAGSDTLAVTSPIDRRVLGYLNEAYLLRRYAEELDRRHNEALGIARTD
ncbi:MAG: chloride channel protein [Hyphomicrobiales bacterium]